MLIAYTDFVNHRMSLLSGTAMSKYFQELRVHNTELRRCGWGCGDSLHHCIEISVLYVIYLDIMKRDIMNITLHIFGYLRGSGGCTGAELREWLLLTASHRPTTSGCCIWPGP